MKLLYFDMAGRAEMIRLALHVGGIDFEDERVPRDQWPVVKPTTPRGQVPTLTLDDGTVLTESGALLRYAGVIGCPRLYPEDPLAAARVDEVGDVINGMAGALEAAVHQPPEVTVTQVTALLAPGGAVATSLAWLNECAAAAGSGHLVGDALSIDDCAMKAVTRWLTVDMAGGAFADALAPYPALAKTVAATSAVPAIAAYEATLKKKAPQGQCGAACGSSRGARRRGAVASRRARGRGGAAGGGDPAPRWGAPARRARRARWIHGGNRGTANPPNPAAIQLRVSKIQSAQTPPHARDATGSEFRFFIDGPAGARARAGAGARPSHRRCRRAAVPPSAPRRPCRPAAVGSSAVVALVASPTPAPCG